MAESVHVSSHSLDPSKAEIRLNPGSAVFWFYLFMRFWFFEVRSY